MGGGRGVATAAPAQFKQISDRAVHPRLTFPDLREAAAVKHRTAQVYTAFKAGAGAPTACRPAAATTWPVNYGLLYFRPGKVRGAPHHYGEAPAEPCHNVLPVLMRAEPSERRVV